MLSISLVKLIIFLIYDKFYIRTFYILIWNGVSKHSTPVPSLSHSPTLTDGVNGEDELATSKQNKTKNAATFASEERANQTETKAGAPRPAHGEEETAAGKQNPSPHAAARNPRLPPPVSRPNPPASRRRRPRSGPGPSRAGSGGGEWGAWTATARGSRQVRRLSSDCLSSCEIGARELDFWSASVLSRFLGGEFVSYMEPDYS